MNSIHSVPTLVLASSSPQRLALLKQIDITPVVHPSTVQEIEYMGETPEQLVQRLADEKASQVASLEGLAAVVAGADSIVDLDGEVLGKPRDEQQASEMLASLLGREHRVLTGVAVCYQGEKFIDFCETFVHLRPADMSEQEAYIACGEWQGRAGGCCVQGRGSLFVEKFQGSYHNVVGLPLQLLDQLCRQAGWGLTSWMPEKSGFVV